MKKQPSTVPANSTWTDADAVTAAAQGWNLFWCEPHSSARRIERDDEAGLFACDEKALEHVRKNAADCEVCRKALALVTTPLDEASPSAEYLAAVGPLKKAMLQRAAANLRRPASAGGFGLPPVA